VDILCLFVRVGFVMCGHVVFICACGFCNVWTYCVYFVRVGFVMYGRVSMVCICLCGFCVVWTCACVSVSFVICRRVCLYVWAL
jgi:hypothetical protein